MMLKKETQVRLFALVEPFCPLGWAWLRGDDLNGVCGADAQGTGGGIRSLKTSTRRF